jgi:hypothetical protein
MPSWRHARQEIPHDRRSDYVQPAARAAALALSCRIIFTILGACVTARLPIALVVTALPCAWIGGAWFRATHLTPAHT